MSLVGFFDILGTREAVMADRLSDLISLDFVGPVGAAAKLFPSLRFAVFSDSVIVSAETGDEQTFLCAVSLIYLNWNADLIYVRGGIAEGDMRWVDYEAVDKMFRSCKNLMFARVYGKGLVLAHEIEQRSGPGAIAFLTERAANVLSSIEKNSVLLSTVPMLCWAPEATARRMVKYADRHLEHEPNEGAARRHAIATKHYWEQIVSQGKFLPDSYRS